VRGVPPAYSFVRGVDENKLAGRIGELRVAGARRFRADFAWRQYDADAMARTPAAHCFRTGFIYNTGNLFVNVEKGDIRLTGRVTVASAVRRRPAPSCHAIVPQLRDDGGTGCVPFGPWPRRVTRDNPSGADRRETALLSRGNPARLRVARNQNEQQQSVKLFSRRP